jgi:hypothetical protein
MQTALSAEELNAERWTAGAVEADRIELSGKGSVDPSPRTCRSHLGEAFDDPSMLVHVQHSNNAKPLLVCLFLPARRTPTGQLGLPHPTGDPSRQLPAQTTCGAWNESG